MEKRDDPTLLQAIRQGDESAFDALFRRYYEPLCHYACSLTEGDMDEAEDLVQQTFVKLWEQRSAFEVQWSVKAYLYKMVHNRCLNRLRDARTREKYKVYNAEQLEQGHEHEPGAASELNERIQQALQALPPECRRIFELSRFEELKYREIADQLGISIKTVETQMGKALRLMRTELADYLVTLIALLQLMLL
ncbi:MAG TPA: RNA polymerase sigma-70 factor [Saprospiraceae bacterium]|nr:RNA polymerase sigma-70 factor [Saprospiraceae bacterium]HPI07516.1 RNA polymerase sigma-70 factor [Saprospiraceae bacterium]